MPPQQRTRKTAAAQPDATAEGDEPTEAGDTAQAPDDEQHEDTREPGPICPACFVGGWNGLPADAATAGCEHGTYTR